MLLLVRHRGSPRMAADAVDVVCMRACETEQAQGTSQCMCGPVRPPEWDGCGGKGDGCLRSGHGSTI